MWEFFFFGKYYSEQTNKRWSELQLLHSNSSVEEKKCVVRWYVFIDPTCRLYLYKYTAMDKIVTKDSRKASNIIKLGACEKNLGINHYPYWGVKFLNSLPLEIKNSKSIIKFKIKVKIYIYYIF